MISPPGNYALLEHLAWISFDSVSQANRGLFAVLTAYFDESRTDDGDYPVVAGFIGEVQQWRKFRKRWQRVLDEAELKSFHWSEFQYGNKDSEFVNWSLPRKQRLLSRLLKALDHFPATRISASMPAKEYRAAKKLIGVKRQDVLASQYELLGYATFVMAGNFAQQQGYSEPIAFVFDDGNCYRDQFCHAHKRAREEANIVRDYRLGSLTFGSDDDSPELQAADMFASSLSRVMFDVMIQRKPGHPLATVASGEVWKRFPDGLEYMMSAAAIPALLKAWDMSAT